MNQVVLNNICPMCSKEMFSDHDLGYRLHIREDKLTSAPDVSNYIAMLRFCQALKPGSPVLIQIGNALICDNCFTQGLAQIQEVVQNA